jgi:NADH:ubiquinone oxidoreductase subunit F (NADH-binding)
MHNVLERISEGKAGKKDLELLQRLTGMVKAASLCGLGQTAPNPTLTTLRYFMDEYRAHIEEGICPAGICNPVKVEEEAEVGI